MPTLTPLTGAALSAALARHPGWLISQDGWLCREYHFDDFAQALGWSVTIGAVAQAIDHHPEITLAWGRVFVRVQTHDVGGLSERDFQFAERLDAIPKPQ